MVYSFLDTSEVTTNANKRVIERGGYQGKNIAVLTSGGDSQGMNAALRAVVRISIYLGCKIYFVREGYQGLVDGGENIEEAVWTSVTNIIHMGGTIIGSSPCPDFRQREGRLKATRNLVQLGITNLIVIGGYDSLIAANIFHREWPSLVEELYSTGRINYEERQKYNVLKLVGMVGSINNDFCGTDMTIGADSALHRILESIDDLLSTAYSQRRTLILEIMGKTCGYLTLIAGICSGADYIFIPEYPPKPDWPQKLITQMSRERAAGQRLNIIIVSEGATDRDGQPITAEHIKKIIVDKLHQDTRITILGHAQRGGNASAFDRILASRMGAEAVMSLMEGISQNVPLVVILDGNDIKTVPLVQCSQRTRAVIQAMTEKNWELAVKLRGASFQTSLEAYKRLASVRINGITKEGDKNQVSYRFMIINVGNPACGTSVAVRSFVKSCVNGGHTVYGAYEGFDGLISGHIKEMEWLEVESWIGSGGSTLGGKQTLPVGKYKEIAIQLREWKIQGIVVIGGFNGFLSLVQLSEQRQYYPEFCIPLVLIPSTIANNVPGTNYTLGCDSALNEITEICDRILQSAEGTISRTFIVETTGGFCGYLATMAGLAGNADAAYIYEDKLTIKEMQDDISHMASKMAAGSRRGLILRNEKASEFYNTDFIFRLYSEEGRDSFVTRQNILGHLQQGGTPSPFDRTMGTKLAGRCFEWIVEQCKKNSKQDGSVSATDSSSVCLIGNTHGTYKFRPLADIVPEADFIRRIPKREWWLKMRCLLKLLARHESTYVDIREKTSLMLVTGF